MVVGDLSFISLALVIPALVAVCHPGAPMVLLVKPQFEAGRSEVSKGRGIITDPSIHDRVKSEIEAALQQRPCTRTPDRYRSHVAGIKNSCRLNDRQVLGFRATLVPEGHLITTKKCHVGTMIDMPAVQHRFFPIVHFRVTIPVFLLLSPFIAAAG